MEDGVPTARNEETTNERLDMVNTWGNTSIYCRTSSGPGTKFNVSTTGRTLLEKIPTGVTSDNIHIDETSHDSWSALRGRPPWRSTVRLFDVAAELVRSSSFFILVEAVCQYSAHSSMPVQSPASPPKNWKVNCERCEESEIT